MMLLYHYFESVDEIEYQGSTGVIGVELYSYLKVLGSTAVILRYKYAPIASYNPYLHVSLHRGPKADMSTKDLAHQDTGKDVPEY